MLRADDPPQRSARCSAERAAGSPACAPRRGGERLADVDADAGARLDRQAQPRLLAAAGLPAA
jgi:hypothetical protein